MKDSFGRGRVGPDLIRRYFFEQEGPEREDPAGQTWEDRYARSRRLPSYEYVPFNPRNPECLHVVLSDRAYNAILAETLAYDRTETGGVLLGHIYKRVWYVTDVIPPGLRSDHTVVHFELDRDFVNYLAGKVADVYLYKPSILGFWHRHPGSMDVFSQEDFSTIYENEMVSRFGVITMLVNIDPALRMTFYHARDGKLMRLLYDHGNDFFPKELLQLASPEVLLRRRPAREGGASLEIRDSRVLSPDKLPRSIHPGPAPGPEPKEPEAQTASAEPAATEHEAQTEKKTIPIHGPEGDDAEAPVSEKKTIPIHGPEDDDAEAPVSEKKTIPIHGPEDDDAEAPVSEKKTIPIHGPEGEKEGSDDGESEE